MTFLLSCRRSSDTVGCGAVQQTRQSVLFGCEHATSVVNMQPGCIHPIGSLTMILLTKLLQLQQQQQQLLLLLLLLLSLLLQLSGVTRSMNGSMSIIS